MSHALFLNTLAFRVLTAFARSRARIQSDELANRFGKAYSAIATLKNKSYIQVVGVSGKQLIYTITDEGMEEYLKYKK